MDMQRLAKEAANENTPQDRLAFIAFRHPELGGIVFKNRATPDNIRQWLIANDNAAAQNAAQQSNNLEPLPYGYTRPGLLGNTQDSGSGYSLTPPQESDIAVLRNAQPNDFSFGVVAPVLPEKPEKRKWRLPAVLLISVLALLVWKVGIPIFASFKSDGDGGGQSIADACKIVEGEMETVNAEMQTALTESMSGEGDIAGAFDPIVGGLDKALKDISNAEVKTATEGMRNVVADFAKTMSGLDLDFEDPAAMEKMEEITAKLETQTADLQAAGEKLDKLCNVK